MLLNSLSQAFVISFDVNFFYPEINKTFLPIMHRHWLCYNTVEDFMNSQISQVNFPGINGPNVEQNITMYEVKKRPAKQTDQLIDKSLTLTIKTTESLLSYFICRNQYEEFLKLGRYMPLYMPDIKISLIDDGGFEIYTYVYHQLTPISISQIDLSYAARLGQFNTFTWQFAYNFYDIWGTDGTGKRVKYTDIWTPQNDGYKGYLDAEKPEYQARAVPARSTKTQLAESANHLRSISKNIHNPGILSPGKL